MNNFKKMLLVITFALVMFVFFACGDKAEITFEQDTINATVNHEFKLNPVVTGDSKEVVYDFDASTFESVSEGTFKAKAAGDYKIKVFLKADAEVFAEVNVKVDNNHTYDKEVVSEEYFASDASCTEKAKYYYSCACGAKGEETFESGDALTHTFDQEVMDEKYLSNLKSDNLSLI